MAKRTPIGYVEATVRFSLYEGDTTDRDRWPWFEFNEPGVTKSGDIGVCSRECETLAAKVHLHPAPALSLASPDQHKESKPKPM